METKHKSILTQIFKKSYLILSLFVIISSCNDDSPEQNNEEEHVGLVSPVGEPLGLAETFDIGAEGGDIKTSDGVIEISIPAGALSNTTTISIQPIENTTPNGIGSSYRLSPEGIEFQMPVTVTFVYSNVSVSFPEGLGVAYQSTDNIWYWNGTLAHDKDNKRISTQTSHFSSWSLFESMTLRPVEASVEPNDIVDLTAYRVLPQTGIAALLEPLVPTDPVALGDAKQLEQKYIKEWELVGEGTLQPSGNTATYTAPASMPDNNPVTVSLEVDPQNGGKAFLLSHITVGGSSITLNGGPYSNLTIKANNPGYASHEPSQNITTIGFSGLDDDGNAIAVNITYPGKGIGQEPWTEQCVVVTSHQINGKLVAGNSIIPSDPPSPHPGFVKITGYGEVGSQVAGSFEGNFTIMDNRCEPICITYGTVKGTFLVPRM